MPPTESPTYRREAMRIAGERVQGTRSFEVFDPFTGRAVGSVPKATVDDVRRAFAIARAYKPRLTRFERADVNDVMRPDL